MPQIKIRGVQTDTICKLSKQLIDELAVLNTVSKGRLHPRSNSLSLHPRWRGCLWLSFCRDRLVWPRTSDSRPGGSSHYPLT